MCRRVCLIAMIIMRMLSSKTFRLMLRRPKGDDIMQAMVGAGFIKLRVGDAIQNENE